MSSASDYLETKVLDHITGNNTYDPPTMFMALFTNSASSAELEQGVLTNEVSGINYTRKNVVFEPASGNQTLNNIDVVFNQAGAGGWGTLGFCAILDAFENGNVLMHGVLSAPQEITEGDTFKFNTTNVSITIT